MKHISLAPIHITSFITHREVLNEGQDRLKVSFHKRERYPARPCKQIMTLTECELCTIAPIYTMSFVSVRLILKRVQELVQVLFQCIRSVCNIVRVPDSRTMEIMSLLQCPNILNLQVSRKFQPHCNPSPPDSQNTK